MELKQKRLRNVPPKVIVVGLDGASFKVIDPLIAGGELPNTNRLMNEGTRSVLTSTIPDITPPSWTSMTTGVNPSKHGVYDFLKIRQGRTRIVTSSDRKSPSIWDMLSKKGKRVIVMNVPVTYPPWPVNGIMVSDMLTPEGATDIVYPEYLSGALRKRGYEVGIRWTGGGVSKKTSVEDLVVHLRRRMETFVWLLEEFDWDFAMIVANETDYVQHLFAGDRAKVASVYRAADEAIRTLINKVSAGATLFVVSDHGFNIATRAFRVNDWLVQNGALKPPPSPPSGVTRGIADFALKKKATSGLARMAERHMPKRVLRSTYASPLDDGEPPDGLSCLAPQPHSYVPLFVNGNFAKTDYDRLLTAVTRNSAELVDEQTGFNPILKVIAKRELYHGPYSIDAPDLVLQLRENYVVSEKFFNSKDLFHRTLQGIHEPSGILIAAGTSVKRHSEITDSYPTVVDITPTILHLLGLTPPSTLDGKIIHGLFAE
jgi:predicted AlkP superfamily phosphohydrolase/phosphomutase